MISSSITICDPDDIFKTVEKLVEMNVQVNAISLSAGLHVLENICEKTGGIHYLAFD